MNTSRCCNTITITLLARGALQQEAAVSLSKLITTTPKLAEQSIGLSLKRLSSSLPLFNSVQTFGHICDDEKAL